MTDDPFKVLVWGPGGLGKIAIREVLWLPEFELAGVLAYDPAKHGQDAGALAGGADVGIAATTNKDEALATEADCVLHAGHRWRLCGSLTTFLGAMELSRRSPQPNYGHVYPGGIGWNRPVCQDLSVEPASKISVRKFAGKGRAGSRNRDHQTAMDLWLAGFVEDEMTLHFATKTIFAELIWHLLEDRPAVQSPEDTQQDGIAQGPAVEKAH